MIYKYITNWANTWNDSKDQVDKQIESHDVHNVDAV